MTERALRFDGSVVVVTGGARGIGLAVSELLARRGASVIVNDTGATNDGRADDAGIASQVARSLTGDGCAAVSNTDDSSSPEGAGRIVASAVEAFGRLDTVVANAGISWPVRFADLTPDDVQRSFAVNAFSPLWLAQAAWPHLAATGGGRVVTVSSAGVFGYPDRVHYTAAKAAVLGLTKALAFEGRSQGTTVNCVLPWAYTRLSTSGDADGWLSANIPPEGVAATIAWLAHPSCPINGELITSSGRHVARALLGVGPGAVVPESQPETLADRVDDVMGIEPIAVPRSTGRFIAHVVRPALDPDRDA